MSFPWASDRVPEEKGLLDHLEMDSTRRTPHKVTQERRGQGYRVGASAAKPKVPLRDAQ